MPLSRPLFRSVWWTLVVIAVLIAGAACGGSDEGGSDKAEPSAVEVWVDDVCSSVGGWQNAMADARTTLSEPKELSVADLQEVLHEVDHATRTLVSDLKTTSAPDTEAGEQVQGELSTLGNQLQEHADVVETSVDHAPETVQELLQQVSTVTGVLSEMATDVRAAYANVREAAGDADLGDAIANSTSCQDLDLGSS